MLGSPCKINIVKAYRTSYFMELNYGICFILILNLYVRLGAKVLDVFGWFCTYFGQCDTLPLLDKLCSICECLTSCITAAWASLSLIHFIIRHGMFFGPIDSVIDRNVLNCALRYHISLDSIMHTDIQPLDISYNCFQINMLHRRLTGVRIGFSILDIVVIEKRMILTVSIRIRCYYYCTHQHTSTQYTRSSNNNNEYTRVFLEDD